MTKRRPHSDTPPDATDPEPASEETVVIIDRVKQGDGEAVEKLVRRSLPPLLRWAHGRLPRHARDLKDTQDVVQEAMMATLRRIGDFKPKHRGAFQAYLRQAVKNKIRDEVRRLSRRGTAEELKKSHSDQGPSPLDETIGREVFERYEQALEMLRPDDRVAVILRIEMRYNYEVLAAVLGKPSADAARMTVGRALARVGKFMRGPANEKS